MQAYERKIIHSKLQGNPKIETISEGQEPHRRIVISLKNNLINKIGGQRSDFTIKIL